MSRGARGVGLAVLTAALGMGSSAGAAASDDEPAAGAPAPTAVAAPRKPAAKRASAKKHGSGAQASAGPGDGAGRVVPGFETLADGSTRLFVQLARPVKYETKAAGKVFTCVLKGTHVDKRNNTNPLVTVHFNTPVTSARLVPHGGDLWFVVGLRAKVTPSVTLDETKDGGAMLRLEFPKGDYVPAAPVAAPPETGTAAPDDDTAPDDGAQSSPPPAAR